MSLRRACRSGSWRAAAEAVAVAALAHRLDHWAAVLDVHAFDVEVGVGRALELAEARLA